MSSMSLESLRFSTLLKAGGVLDRLGRHLPSGLMPEDEQAAWITGAHARELTETLDLLGAGYGLTYRFDAPKNGSSYLHVDAPHARFTVRLSDHPMPPSKGFFQRDTDGAPTIGMDLSKEIPDLTIGSLATRMLVFFALAPQGASASIPDLRSPRPVVSISRPVVAPRPRLMNVEAAGEAV